MSADSYDICPKCKSLPPEKGTKEELLRKFKEAVEKETDPHAVKQLAIEYEGLLKELDSIEPTFAEYYEVFQRDGILHFSYGAVCDLCDYKFKWKPSIMFTDLT